MILKLDVERLRTIDEVRDFMAGSEPVDFHLAERSVEPPENAGRGRVSPARAHVRPAPSASGELRRARHRNPG